MSQLKTKLFILVACCGFVVTTVFAQTTATTMLQDLLSRYTTYQANFTQITYDSKGREIQQSSGKVYLMRPGKFRWDTQKPNQQVVIANNNVLWIYDVLLQQVTRSTIKKSKDINPATLLTGDAAEILRQFSIQQAPNRGREVTFKLTAKSSKSAFQSVQMQFQKGRLTAMLVRNNLGQTNIFRFAKIKLNSEINPQLFNFKAPPGAQVSKQ